MPFHPSVLGQLVQPISRPRFQAAAGGRARWGLSDWAHLMTLVAAQLAGACSLRDLTRLLERHEGGLAHLGIKAVRRSTLADANAKRDPAAFEAVVAQLSERVAKEAPGLCREAVRLIDATRICAGKRVEAWSADGAVKLHVVHDPVLCRTTAFAVTPARTNDIVAARGFPIEPGATYVFDRGYYDFSFWARLAAAGCRFVTPLKKRTPIKVVETRPLSGDPTSPVLSDIIGTLPERLKSTRLNPCAGPLRVLEVRLETTGRVMRLVSNDLTAPAEEIAELYKTRWRVELFFRWVKQNLKLRHFLGTGENAVRLQILAALIAHLIVRLAELRGRTTLGPQACARLVGAALFERRDLIALIRPPPANRFPTQTPQLALAIDLG
jgi:hypothetical protein